jgi:hypothetical protein
MARYYCKVRDAIVRPQSIVEMAAYNRRDQYRNERTGELTEDHRDRQHEVLFAGIFVDPKFNAPEWVNDSEKLFNQAAHAEKRTNAREGQEIHLNLPHELTHQQHVYMLTDFVREHIVRGTGRVADSVIHDAPKKGDNRNIHAHVLFTLRAIGPNGFEGKRLEVTDEHINRWKAKWAERGAKELRKAGFDKEADRWAVGHLSNEKQREAAMARGDFAYAKR